MFMLSTVGWLILVWCCCVIVFCIIMVMVMLSWVVWCIMVVGSGIRSVGRFSRFLIFMFSNIVVDGCSRGFC